MLRRMMPVLFVLLFAVGSLVAQDDTIPEQIDYALAALSQGVREDVSIQDLAGFDWSRQNFPDTSLGCPEPGVNYAQVITPGYQFLLNYAGTIYDYRVNESGETVVLCDTRAAPPIEPTPTQDLPATPCGDTYDVQSGDTLIGIAQECNTTVAALLDANPEITDPSLIYPSQVLTVPGDGVQRAVSIRPDSGPAATTIRVFASGFPPGAQVELGLGPPESEYVVVANREIGDDGELEALLQISQGLEPGTQRVAVVVYNFQETVSEPFTVTEGQFTPEPTPTEPADGVFEQTQTYLVALGDEGRSGQEIGCGDSLIPVTVSFEPTPAPLTAALNELFAIDSRTYGQSGLYNALYRSDLQVEGINIIDREAIINLTGTLQIGGVCDEPRVMAQIEQTALQYDTIDRVSVFINGQPLSEVF